MQTSNVSRLLLARNQAGKKGKPMNKQERYEQLRRITEAEDAEYNDELYTEQCLIFYELNPKHQYWRDTSPELTPRDVWGVDTSKYK